MNHTPVGPRLRLAFHMGWVATSRFEDDPNYAARMLQTYQPKEEGK